MLGKPIALATIADLERLIRDETPEGRHLEYKVTVPVSREQQKVLAKEGVGNGSKIAVVVDRAVATGSGIGDYGRNKILEELVAFANADGGVIVLGMAETANSPPRAQSIQRIPHVVALERRLLDQIIDQIEPRLPDVSAKAIAIGEDGAGVLLLQTQGSVLGPHWVKASRSATIRREDKCVALSMPEIHDMVLRNARRFDEVRRRLDLAREEFANRFISIGYELTQPGSKIPIILDQWFAGQTERRLVGIRTSIVPHQPLGLSRLESMKHLTSAGSVEGIDKEGSKISATALLFSESRVERQKLGGVESVRGGRDFSALLRADRDGGVTAWAVWHWDTSQLRLCISWLLGIVGSAVSVFDNLRTFGGRPNLPAEIDVEIRTIRDVPTQLEEGYFSAVGEPLIGSIAFDPVTLGGVEGFDAYLNAVAGDFANAIGLPSDLLPYYKLRRAACSSP